MDKGSSYHNNARLFPMNPHKANECNNKENPHNLTQSSDLTRIMKNIQLHIT